METTGTQEMTDNSFANGEQGEYTDEDVRISQATTWFGEVEEEQDFIQALKKVSRRIKK